MVPSGVFSSNRVGNRLLDINVARGVAASPRTGGTSSTSVAGVVCEVGEPSPHVYFPISSVFSAIVPLRDGSAIEAGTIGSEGLVGVELITDRSVSVYQCIQQVEGVSLRIPAKEFRTLLSQGGRLPELLDRYLLTVVHQSGQTAACNVRHSVDERMCRWLLMTQDRAGRDSFYLTQEFLGIMLGVRRQSVSLSA